MLARILARKAVHRYAGHPFRLLTFVAKSFFAFHIVWRYFYSVEGTLGASMLPTFDVVDDRVLISKYYRRGRGVKVGDVIAFRSVVNPDEDVIKRVVGLSGDYVLRDTPGTTSDTMIQVPEGHCWVVGDNLIDSRDSRHFGPMPMALIRGKVIAKGKGWLTFPIFEREWLDDGLQSVD